MLDFSNAPAMTNFDLIPEGEVVKVMMDIKPGGKGEGGWLTASQSSDAVGLNAAFTVMEGPYAKRKIFSWMTWAGGKVDDEGNSKGAGMTKAALRAIIESHYGLDPNDTSPEATNKKQIDGFQSLVGMAFWGKVGVTKPKPGDAYGPKNTIVPLTPDKDGYGGPVGTGGGGTMPQPNQQAAQSNVPAWAR